MDGLLGFSAGSSLLGQVIDALVLIVLVLCAAKCCRAMCRPRWSEEVD